MKWQPEYATGDAQIDEQHKTLFTSTDQYREALEEGQGSNTYDLFLQFLQAYAHAHFGAEEQCMHARKCPMAGRNQKEHAGFIKMLGEEQARFDRDGFDHAAATALLNRIDAWLVSHICRIDVHLRNCPAA